MIHEYTHPTFGTMHLYTNQTTLPGKALYLACDSYHYVGVDSRYLRNTIKPGQATRMSRKLFGVQCPRPNVVMLTEAGIVAFVKKYAGKKAAPYIQWLREISRIAADQCNIVLHKPTDEAALMDKIIATPDFGIRLLTELKAERERRETRTKADIINEFTKWLDTNYQDISA